MNVLFDMETGDPDDLITLLMLLNNPDVYLRGITCYQGSPIQIGLISHVLNLANVDIPVGGWNSVEPQTLSPYYTEVVGEWPSKNATLTPVEVFKEVFEKYPDVQVLTGAPLTNLKIVLDELPHLNISNMVTQGGYLGDLAEEPLDKFKGKNEFRTYNLGNDVEAFTAVNFSQTIEKITYVTKDICHGFLYTPAIHKEINFSSSPIGKLLKSCLEKYALANKPKAMHDPLAMLVMLYPEFAKKENINMNYRIDHRGFPVFSSVLAKGSTSGVVNYDKLFAWNKFISICENQLKLKNNSHIQLKR